MKNAKVKGERNLRVKALEAKIDRALSMKKLLDRSLEELEAELEAVKRAERLFFNLLTCADAHFRKIIPHREPTCQEQIL